MIFPVDIHTHHETCSPGTAIVNCFPSDFVPVADQWYSVGFHPWKLSPEITAAEWESLGSIVAHPQVLAVGEAGLDKLVQTPLAWQQEVFCKQAGWAERVHKPLIIHLVKAADELLRLKRDLCPAVPWILHGFRGKPALAEMWVRHGFYLSFGEKYQAEALARVPSERLFLETDESRQPVDELYEQVAALRGCTSAELYETVHRNVRKVFFKQ